MTARNQTRNTSRPLLHVMLRRRRKTWIRAPITVRTRRITGRISVIDVMIAKTSAMVIKISMDEKEYRIGIKVKNNLDLREIEKIRRYQMIHHISGIHGFL
jgi:hypothetical protein